MIVPKVWNCHETVVYKYKVNFKYFGNTDIRVLIIVPFTFIVRQI